MMTHRTAAALALAASLALAAPAYATDGFPAIEPSASCAPDEGVMRSDAGVTCFPWGPTTRVPVEGGHVMTTDRLSLGVVCTSSTEAPEMVCR